MKNKEYIQSKTRKKLDILKSNGKKSVVWSLRHDMANFLTNFYDVTPFLYTIRTKTLPNIRFVHNKLLKDIHYSNKNGKKFLTRKLSQTELDMLRMCGISYRILKYKIVLN